MKVLSGHTVTKLQSEDSMELLIMPSSPIQVKPGSPLFQETTESNLISSSRTDNINRKRWRKVFRRVQRKNMDSDFATPPQKSPLFGQPLSNICQRDGRLPEPIMDILSVLRRKGPNTELVFRKAGNSRAMKEIMEKLNNGVEVDLKDEPVILLADLLKKFLGQMPASLLNVEQYQAWMTAMEKEDKCPELRMVINKLPGPNIYLLKHLMVVLYHISVNAEENKMDSNNLAICVSPNLLQSDKVEKVKNVTTLTQFLIDNCSNIFGEDSLTLLEDSDEEEFSDRQASLTSLGHDSAYDSNDPDVDGFKGSYTDMHDSDAEKNVQVSSSPEGTARQSIKPFIRRCSEPTIAFNQGARIHPALSRSQTEMDFYSQNLTKQISDECVSYGTDSKFSPETKSCGLTPSERPLQCSTKVFSSCSSSSLESTFSTASESSIQTSSPIISSTSQRQALQRKQSFPGRPAQHGDKHSESTKKRSQSMKVTNSRSKAHLCRVYTSKRAEKALRHSQTLPEMLLPPKPRRLSSEEVFHHCDSRIPSEPPSYKQAVHDNGHIALSHRSSLTVEAARCLSKYTCGQSTLPTAETSNSCSRKNCSDVQSCEDAAQSLAASANLLESRQNPQSQTMYETSNTTLTHCCDRVLDVLNVRESYV